MSGRSGSAGRVLWVSAEDHRSLRQQLSDETQWTVETAGDADDAVSSCDGQVDCVLARFELADGTARDLAERLAADGPPVVALVERDGDCVPADCLAPELAEAVLLTGGESDVDRIVDAVERFVPTGDGPAIATEYLTGVSSLCEWKATLFDQYFTEVPLHLFVKDGDGRHLCVSQASIGDRMDRTVETYLGKRDTDGVISESNAQEPHEDDRTVIEGGESILEKEEHYPTSGDWFLTSKVPWHDDEGEVAGLLGVSQDITERKQREQHLRVTNHMLRHNLRNELTVINGGSRYLRGQIDETDESVVDRIDRASRRLLDKIEKQQVVVNLLTTCPRNEAVDVGTIVRDESTAVSRRYPDATIRCRCDGTVRASAVPQIRFAVRELVRNATEHADDEPRVVVEVEPVVDGVAVTVTDDCVPIPDHEIAVLSGDEPLTQLNHGAGLGLWMTHLIVTRSNGSIDFETTDGGNVVTLTLSAADADERGQTVESGHSG